MKIVARLSVVLETPKDGTMKRNDHLQQTQHPYYEKADNNKV